MSIHRYVIKSLITLWGTPNVYT